MEMAGILMGEKCNSVDADNTYLYFFEVKILHGRNQRGLDFIGPVVLQKL